LWFYIHLNGIAGGDSESLHYYNNARVGRGTLSSCG